MMVELTLWSQDKVERSILAAVFIGDDGEDLHLTGTSTRPKKQRLEIKAIRIEQQRL